MADPFIFQISGAIIGKISSPIFQELSLAWGVRDELQKLKNTMSSIHAVLLDAQEQQASNHQLRDWLGKLNDALYDAEIVLDEFDIDALRCKMFEQSIVSKVSNFFSRSNQLAFRFKMAHKIKKIREVFDQIAADRNKYNLIERYEERIVIRRKMTHSFVRVDDVIGRERDREDVINFLLDTSDHENVSVLPIVGLGGLGKTTLAKMVYNDKIIIGNFDLRIWVCISEDFDIEKIIKKILKSLHFQNCDRLEFDQLQNRLRQKLDGKKYLLILDDVWNESRVKWIELRNLLMGGAIGSKIIVTTRNKPVASIMTTTGSILEIKGLSHEECLSLFLKWSFRSSQDAARHPKLVEIAGEIVEKSRGVPLAIITLGNLLYMKTQVRDWVYVRDNDIWKIEQKEGDILHVLKLSYDQLPTNLRQCFSFCSLFPKDHQFNSNELIYYWSALGLLRQSDYSEDVEDVGMKYIEQLWSMGFFQDVFEEFGTGLCFKMHDLVHDLALLVAEKTVCIIMDFQEVQLDYITRKMRHLSFQPEYLRRNKIPNWLLEQKDVRTIYFPYAMVPGMISLIQTCISKFKHLHFLDLSYSSFEVLPSSIGSLKHLKYLSLLGNEVIKSLPASIGELLGLETLNFRGCLNIGNLPKGLGKLTRLRYLSITTKVWCLPDNEFRCLTSLRHLRFYNCPNIKFVLSDDVMQRLSALQTLRIGRCESLVSLPTRGLRRLEALFIWDCVSLQVMMNDRVLNNGDEAVAGGEGLHNLRFLELLELPKLVALPLWILPGANNLERILIYGCENITNIMPEQMLQNFRSLQKLSISNCPKLTCLPERLSSLTALDEIWIENSPELARRCHRETGEDWQKISHVPNIYLDNIKI